MSWHGMVPDRLEEIVPKLKQRNIRACKPPEYGSSRGFDSRETPAAGRSFGEKIFCKIL
jgi:hypothetical protein